MNSNESIKLEIEVDPYRTRTMKREEDEIRLPSKSHGVSIMKMSLHLCVTW